MVGNKGGISFVILTVIVGVLVLVCGRSEATILLDETKIMASDAQMDDTFGEEVAISGDSAVVGAPGEDGGAGDPVLWAGAAYVHERNAGGANHWGEVKKLSAGDAGMDDYFGTAVAIDGDTIVVGAAGEDGGPGNPLPFTGAAYVFGRNQGGPNNWGQVAKLTADEAQEDDNFGVSVAIDGDMIVVGANFEDGGPGDPMGEVGAAYIYERNQGGANNWGQIKKLSHGDAQPGDFFGRSLSLNGDTLLVSASGEDGGAGDPISSAGAVYIFERNQGGAGNWGQVKKLTSNEAQASDFFAWPSIDDDTIVVGAPGENGGPGDPISNAGAAYIFERNQGGAGNWGFVKKITAGDPDVNDFFGPTVSISGDTIIVGADDEDGGMGDPLPESGAVYIFERNAGGPNNWGEVEKVTASDAQEDDFFGRSVYIDGGTFIVSAHQEDGGPGDPVTDGGAAYIYRDELDMVVFLPVVVMD